MATICSSVGAAVKVAAGFKSSTRRAGGSARSGKIVAMAGSRLVGGESRPTIKAADLGRPEGLWCGDGRSRGDRARPCDTWTIRGTELEEHESKPYLRSYFDSFAASRRPPHHSTAPNTVDINVVSQREYVPPLSCRDSAWAPLCSSPKTNGRRRVWNRSFWARARCTMLRVLRA